jgi:ankyrin
MRIQARGLGLRATSRSLACFALILVTDTTLSCPARAQEESSASAAASGNDLQTKLGQAIVEQRWKDVLAGLEQGGVPRDSVALLVETLQATLEGDLLKTQSLKITRALLPAAGNLNTIVVDDRSLLTWTVFLDQPALTEAVLARGAAVDSQDSNGLSALAWAEIIGSMSVRHVLLKAGANPKLRDKGGRTPEEHAKLRVGDSNAPDLGLDDGSPVSISGTGVPHSNNEMFAAVAANQPLKVAALLKAHSSRTAKTQEHNEPLQLAAALGFQEVAAMLIKGGADLKTKSSDGFTPLELAVRAGKPQMVQWLLEQAPAGERGQWIKLAGTTATKFRQCRILHGLLALGWRPASPEEGGLALVNAVQACDHAHVDALFQAGVTPGTIEVDQWTPPWPPPLFHAAAETGDIALCKSLTAQVASKSRDVLRAEWQAVLPLAVVSGSRDLVASLLDEFQLEVNQSWKEPSRGIASSRIFHRPDGTGVIRTMSQGGGYEARGQKDPGLTPVSLATACGDVDMTKLLLDRGALPDGRTQGGLRTASMAVHMENLELLKLLLARGAQPDAPNVDGGTALHEAVRRSRQDLAELLLKKGAKLDVRNDKKQTPAGLARDLGNNAMAQWLDSQRAASTPAQAAPP